MGRLDRAALWACVWICTMGCVKGVRLQNGVYEDLVLAVDPTMPMELDTMNISQLQHNIEALIQDMGDSMTTATNGQLSLGSVRVVLPITWNNTDMFDLVPSHEDFSWASADIRLQEAPTGSFGEYTDHAPQTLQMGQCGVPGRYITIHDTFLDQDYAETHYGPRGHVLMHEWAHYRWGVFEEYGHPKDPVYPVSYEKDGLTLPTACYGGTLFGDFLTGSGEPCPGAHDDTNNPCYFFPNETIDPATTKSSLMSHTYLSDGSFCTQDTHDMFAPTPQNKMCGQRSVWEVLKTHPDFSNSDDSGQQTKNTAISISFQKAPTGRVFFLFEAPPTDQSRKTLTWLVRQYIQQTTELLGVVELGMATFRTVVSGQAEIINMLDFTSVADYSSVESYIPGPATDPASDVPLQDALLQLLESWEVYQPGTILIPITWNSVIAKDAEDLSAVVLDKRVKLLVLDASGMQAQGHVLPLMPLLQNTGGNFYIEDYNISNPVDQLLEDLSNYTTYQFINDHRLIGVSHHTLEANSGVQPFMTLMVQSGVEKKISGYLRITPFDSNSIEVTIADPKTWQPISCNTEGRNLILQCINFADGIFIYFYTVNIFVFDYSISIENRGADSVMVETTWSAVENLDNENRVSVSVWSSESELKAGVPENANVFLYCQVSQPSGRVVENLQVMAEVVFELSNYTQVISLTDDGDRVVDVKARDSVWSGQLNGDWPVGTTFTVKTLTVNHDPDIFSPFKLHNTFRPRGAVAGGLAGSSSGVLPIDPTEGACCLSFSDERGASRNLVVNRMLLFPYRANIMQEIVPPGVTEMPKLDPNDSYFIDNDTVTITFHLEGQMARQRASTMYEYLVRYHEDLAIIQDNFTQAKEPLDGFRSPGDATNFTVTIAVNGSDHIYLAVAIYNPYTHVEGPPSTAMPVEVSTLSPPTTAATTTTRTTTTTEIPTTTTTTTTPKTTKVTTTTTTTTTPKSTSSTSESPNDAYTPEYNAVIMVAAVVCAVGLQGQDL